MIHVHSKGSETKTEAEKWFAVQPSKSDRNVIRLAALPGKKAQ